MSSPPKSVLKFKEIWYDCTVRLLSTNFTKCGVLQVKALADTLEAYIGGLYVEQVEHHKVSYFAGSEVILFSIS